MPQTNGFDAASNFDKVKTMNEFAEKLKMDRPFCIGRIFAPTGIEIAVFQKIPSR